MSSEDDEPDDSTEDDEDPTFMSKTKDFAKQVLRKYTFLHTLLSPSLSSSS